MTQIQRMMALNVRFKPGIKQSMLAAHYFNGSAEEAMSAAIEAMDTQQYRVCMPDGAYIDLRLWSGTEFDETEFRGLLDWLAEVHRDINALGDPDPGPKVFEQVVLGWLAQRDPQLNFFLEQYNDGAEEEAMPDLSFGVMGGRVVMISTDHLMFTRLEPKVHGLSIARRGSYLLEEEVVQRRA